MTSPEQVYFPTTDIELSAAIITLIESRPTLYPDRNPGGVVEILFILTDEIRLIAQRYATGELMVPVKRFATSRKMLCTYIQEVERTRREVAL